MKRLYGIRGAVCTENTAESIRKNVGDMCAAIFRSNNLSADDFVSIQFTMTPDLNQLNAAAALRQSDTGVDTSKAALFTSLEVDIPGMLPKTVRVLVTAYLEEDSEIHHVYLNGAEVLRPGFANK